MHHRLGKHLLKILMTFVMSFKLMIEANVAKIISSIKTTMSDLGPVNPLFNAQLKVHESITEGIA